jgi:hypothetical protein
MLFEFRAGSLIQFVDSLVAPFIDCIICSLLRTVCVPSAMYPRVHTQSDPPVSSERWPAAGSASGKTFECICTSTVSACCCRVWPRPPSCSHEILCLYPQRAHLSILCALLDVLDELLLLIFQLHALAVKLPLRLLECTLVLAQSLSGRHALAKGPFYDLQRLARAQCR